MHIFNCISPESVHLSAFICPFGKYVMLRIPRGCYESVDWLNIETRCLLASLSRSLKIMDDLLLQPKNGTKAYKLCARTFAKGNREEFEILQR